MESKKQKRRKIRKNTAINKEEIIKESQQLQKIDKAFSQINSAVKCSSDHETIGNVQSGAIESHLSSQKCLLCKRDRSNDDCSYSADYIYSKLHMWVCSSCRKSMNSTNESIFGNSVDEIYNKYTKSVCNEENKSHVEQTFVIKSEDTSFSSGEPGESAVNGNVCSCTACSERRMMEVEYQRETLELQKAWSELRCQIWSIYRENDGDCADAHTASNLDSDAVCNLVDRLCYCDPHQLYCRLDSQTREYVQNKKQKLLKQLSTGQQSFCDARTFIKDLLLTYYYLCIASCKLAALLQLLEHNHLKRFKVTWELHDKHVFYSVIYSDPIIHKGLQSIIEQLKQAISKSEKDEGDDSYASFLRQFLNFEDEMRAIHVVWHDCQKYIDAYNNEQAAVRVKQKMLKEDWEFFKQQRRLLEQKVSRNSDDLSYCSPENSLNCPAELDERFTETMRHILEGSKGQLEERQCQRCNQRSCPCDECTINHMITCGLISPEAVEPNNLTRSLPPPFMHDSSRYVIDVTPPSLSSAGSSSRTSSPQSFKNLVRLYNNENHDTYLSCESVADSQSGDDGGIDYKYYAVDTPPQCDSPSTSTVTNIADCIPVISTCITVQNWVNTTSVLNSLTTVSSDGVDESRNTCDCHHCIIQNLSQPSAEQINSEQCQCSVCQQQRLNLSSSTLCHDLPTMTRPAEFHLYPHIHGSVSKQQSALPLNPHLYDLHISPLSPLRLDPTDSAVNSRFEFENEISHNIYNAFSEWENTRFTLNNLSSSTTSKLSIGITDPPVLSSRGPVYESQSKTGSSIKPASDMPNCFSLDYNMIPQEFHFVASEVLNKSHKVLSVSSDENIPLSPYQSPLAQVDPPLSPCHAIRPSPIGGNTKVSFSSGDTSNYQCKSQTRTTPMSVIPSTLHCPVSGRHLDKVSQYGSWQVDSCATSLASCHLSSMRPVSTHCTHSRSPPPGSMSNNYSGSGHNLTGFPPQPLTTPLQTGNYHSRQSVSNSSQLPCQEAMCNGHLAEDDEDESLDDSRSDKSSSESVTSNQKEGKYCDCCYCEFFGHSNPPSLPTSKNFHEMREKLRQTLKRRTQLKDVASDVTKSKSANDVCLHQSDYLGDKSLDELMRYINDSTDNQKPKPVNSKAAKRARQKQRKAELKKSQFHSEEWKNPEVSSIDIIQNISNFCDSLSDLKPTRNKKGKKDNCSDINTNGNTKCHTDDYKKLSSPKNSKSTCENNNIKESHKLSNIDTKRNSKICDSECDGGKKLCNNDSKRNSKIDCSENISTKKSHNTETKRNSKISDGEYDSGKKCSQVPVNMQNNYNISSARRQDNKALDRNMHSSLKGNIGTDNAKKSRTLEHEKNLKNKSQLHEMNGIVVNKSLTKKTSKIAQVTNGFITDLMYDVEMAHKNKYIEKVQTDVPSKPSSISTITPSKCTSDEKPFLPSTSTVGLADLQKHSKSNKKDKRNTLPTKSTGSAAISENLPFSQPHLIKPTNSKPESRAPSVVTSSTVLLTSSCITQPIPSLTDFSKSNASDLPLNMCNGKLMKSNSKNKRKTKKLKNSDVADVDEIFLPKTNLDLEYHELDEAEREVEEFKRFCFDCKPSAEDRVQVNVNLRGIFHKKK